MTKKAFTELSHSLKELYSIWPKPIPKKVGHLFEKAQKNLTELKKNGIGHLSHSKKDKSFDFVDFINQLLKTHDFLFLSRKLSYHVVTTTDLPRAFGSQDEGMAVLTELLAFSAKHADFNSRLEIQIKSVQLRAGPAIEIKFIYQGKTLTELDHQKILEKFYGKETGGISLARMSLRKFGGQFWLEFPKQNHVALTFNWPAFDMAQDKAKRSYSTYQYDILITDYSKIRQRFGIVRARKMLGMVENFVKTLVRHPVDMVMAFPERGMVTAIYESQEGTASSVSTRISQKLKKETFRLGRKNVSPQFRYQLSFLA